MAALLVLESGRTDHGFVTTSRQKPPRLALISPQSSTILRLTRDLREEWMMMQEAIAWATLNPMIVLTGVFMLHGVILLASGGGRQFDA
jgi:hypothetical protein